MKIRKSADMKMIEGRKKKNNDLGKTCLLVNLCLLKSVFINYSIILSATQNKCQSNAVLSKLKLD